MEFEGNLLSELELVVESVIHVLPPRFPGPQPVCCSSAFQRKFQHSSYFAQRISDPLVIRSVHAILHMSGINFNSWTENATRLGMRIQETLAERTRDFTLTGSGEGYYDTGEEKTKNIRSQLDSGSDREKLEAMKRLIAVSAYPAQMFLLTRSHPVIR